MTWIDGLEERGRAALPPEVFDYIATGAGTSISASEAPQAWSRSRFMPRTLTDVSAVDLRTRLLGHVYDVPWGIAPTTLQRAVHPDGELAMARACAESGSVLVVSSNAGTSFADIAATGVNWWLQIYVPSNRRLAVPLLARAVASGARAIVLTVDAPVVSTKPTETNVFSLVDEAILRVNFDAGYEASPGSNKATDLGPADIGWLAEGTGLPIVVKGVLRKDDAQICVDAGARAIWVSNHGGRQLDRAAATARCLSGVAKAVGPSTEVYVDGGVRTGLDALSALSLGATAVFAGRDPLFALVDGRSGVAQWHAAMRSELTEALRLGGICRPSEAPSIRAPDRLL